MDSSQKWIIGGLALVFLFLVLIVVMVRGNAKKDKKKRKNMAAKTAGYLKTPEKVQAKTVKDIYNDLIEDDLDEEDENDDD